MERGPYGIGSRMNLHIHRSMVTAAINGNLERCAYKHHEIFNLDMPMSCPGVPDDMLDPINTWSDKKSIWNLQQKTRLSVCQEL